MRDCHLKPYGDGVADIKNYFSEVRKARELTIRGLAAELGVYPNSIQQWLDPNSNSSLDNIVDLGNALGITFSMSNTRNRNCSAKQLVACLVKAKVYEELNTRELAEMTGIVQPSIVGILNGSICPRLNAFLIIADALGVDFELSLEE